MKHIYKISACLVLSLCIWACSSDDDIDGVRDINALPQLNSDDGTISVFDTNRLITIDIKSFDGVSISSMEVLSGDTKVADVTINGETGTFNTSSLLNTNSLATGTRDLILRYTTSDGLTATVPISLEIDKSISITRSPARVPLKSNREENFVTFETFTAGATIDDVEAFYKIGEEGMQINTGLSFNTEKDSINLNDRDYLDYGVEIGDTLFYDIVASSGALTDTISTSIIFTTLGFGNVQSGIIDNGDNQLYSLASNETVDGEDEDEIENAEVMFEIPANIRSTDNSDIQFVRVALPAGINSTQEYFDQNDLIRAIEVFDSGAKSDAIVNARLDDLYVYRVTRQEGEEGKEEEVVYFGTVIVKDVAVINNVTVAIAFDYREAQAVEP